MQKYHRQEIYKSKFRLAFVVSFGIDFGSEDVDIYTCVNTSSVREDIYFLM